MDAEIGNLPYNVIILLGLSSQGSQLRPLGIFFTNRNKLNNNEEKCGIGNGEKMAIEVGAGSHPNPIQINGLTNKVTPRAGIPPYINLLVISKLVSRP